MLRHEPNPLTHGPRKLLLGVIAIALVLVSSTLSVTHIHADNADDHGTCSLCVAAHMALDVTAPVEQAAAVLVFIQLEPASPVARVFAVPHFALFSRPPPAALPLA